MNILGIGPMEFLLIVAIGVMVVGPKRLVEGLRAWRKAYTELKRQRDELVAMVEEAVELEEIKRSLSTDEIEQQIETVRDELALDQIELDHLPIKSMSRPRSVPLSGPGEKVEIPEKPEAEVNDSEPWSEGSIGEAAGESQR